MKLTVDKIKNIREIYMNRVRVDIIAKEQDYAMDQSGDCGPLIEQTYKNSFDKFITNLEKTQDFKMTDLEDSLIEMFKSGVEDFHFEYLPLLNEVSYYTQTK